jgi:hypothetical protein
MNDTPLRYKRLEIWPRRDRRIPRSGVVGV